MNNCNILIYYGKANCSIIGQLVPILRKIRRNEKFLSLHGANITSSAQLENALRGKDRALNTTFFNEYSNTDFQKYFGKFNIDHDNNNIH